MKVAAALADTGLDPRRLELEITEAVLIADDDAALVALNQLRALGVRIALDDFGTGYSSLSYLQRFPFDKIKIDRSFVNELTRGTGSASIIKAVVSIAADRNMVTTAEGVETEEQRQAVQALGCTQMQGYLFSPPRRARDVRGMLGLSEGKVENAGAERLFRLAAAIIGLAKTRGLRVVFRTEPALGIVQAGIAAAGLQMVDADIAGDAGAHRVFALDGAARRHVGIGRKQHRTDFWIELGPACIADERGVLFPEPEIRWRDEAAFPEAAAVVLCRQLVRLELSLGIGKRKTLLDQELAEADALAFDDAQANAPFLVLGIGAEIAAADLLAVDQLCQLVARLDAAGPGVGVFVDAHLVDGRRVDAVEAEGVAACKLQRAAVLHAGRCAEGCRYRLAEKQDRGEEERAGPHEYSQGTISNCGRVLAQSR